MYIREEDLYSTLLQPWLLEEGSQRAVENVEESVVLGDVVLGIVAQCDVCLVSTFSRRHEC